MFWGRSDGHTLTVTWCCDDTEGGVMETIMSGPFIKAILQCYKPKL